MRGGGTVDHVTCSSCVIKWFDNVILTHTSHVQVETSKYFCMHTHILRMPRGQPVGREEVGRSHVEIWQMYTDLGVHIGHH